MPIDPRIALGYQAPQFESPLNTYAKFAQIQGMQQQQQINALQLAAAQREEEQRNALRELDPSSPEYGQKLYRISPQVGAQYAKEQAAVRASQAKEAESKTSAAKTRQQMLAQARRDISNNPSDAQIMAHTEDIQSSDLFSPEEKAKSLKTQEILLGMPVEQRKSWLSQQGASAGELTPKQAAKTELARLLEEQKNYAPGSPEFNAYQRAIDKQSTHAPAVKVNVGGTMLEKEEQKEKGKFNVESYKDISNLAKIAVRTLPSLETQERILDQGFKTGFGTDAQKAAASVLSALGVPEAATYAANAESFGAAANQAVLSKQLEQRGPQTEADAKRIEATGARLSNTPEGNKFIISVAKAQLRRDLEQRNFYDKWWRENKTYEGAEDAWYAGEGAKSLFDRPELKNYSEKQPSQSKQSLSPIDKSALDWANANPNDPRSAQIKQRLGVK